MFLILGYTAIQLIPIINLEFQEANFVGQTNLLFAIIGGVGGSFTILSYSYWMNEKGWKGREVLSDVRFDLRLSYGVTLLFMLCLVLIASGIPYTENVKSGSQMIIAISQVLGQVIGPLGEGLFKICFWGVVFSSLLTVWSGIPYLFCDFIKLHVTLDQPNISHAESKYYRGFLLFISLAPVILAFSMDSVRNVINYAILSSLFVLILTITLLKINNSIIDMTHFTNSKITNGILLIGILIFGGLVIHILGH